MYIVLVHCMSIVANMLYAPSSSSVFLSPPPPVPPSLSNYMYMYMCFWMPLQSLHVVIFIGSLASYSSSFTVKYLGHTEVQEGKSETCNTLIETSMH